MATLIYKLVVLLVAAVGSAVEWWGWAAFWFAMASSGAVKFNNKSRT